MLSLRYHLFFALSVAVPLRAQSVADRPNCERPATTSVSPTVAPIDVSNNHVFVTVCVKGRALEFILDTGAGSSFFDLGTAQRLGFTLQSSFNVRGAGAGSVAGGRIGGAAVAIAGTDVRQPIASAIDISRLPAREGHRMDGILGYDFISRFVVAIDYVKRELRLYDRDTFRYEGGGTSLPVLFVNNHPHVIAEVRLADGAIIKGPMVVDVGSAGSLSLTKPWVDEHRLRDRVGPLIQRRGGGGVGGPTSYAVGRVAALVLGGLEVSKPTASLYGDSAGVFTDRGPWVGNIGGEILRRFTVFLDYKNKQIILEPHAETQEPFEADMSGAGVMMNDSLTTIIVDHVSADSPASDAGLKARDSIIAVNGQSASMAVFADLRRRFKREGERLMLSVRRGSETMEILLVTRRLL